SRIKKSPDFLKSSVQSVRSVVNPLRRRRAALLGEEFCLTPRHRWPSEILYKSAKIRFEDPMNRTEKLKRFEKALDLFLDRVRQDPNLLAAVLVGSLTEKTIWRKDAISLWLIEKDGVTKRLRADGEDPRIFRTLVEEGVNLHVELIPRTRFKRMVEGSARTA